MKKLFWVVTIALAWIYGSGFMSLGPRGAMNYLDEWEQLSLNGDADGICEMMHEDLEFSIDDRTTPGRPLDMEGGKEDLCDYYAQVVPAMKLVVSGMNVRRDDVEVSRDWLHPWTAEVSYTEQRSVTMAGIQMKVHTVGEDRVTLVKTLTDGVKIKALHAKTRMTHAGDT
ncbi:hypothetical protein GCM10011487_32350 [Steroidobacter agaridevorans]|uniref:Nuclear transport factor 2 family protein n=2 Tax=Steroidobacter agaridevorans TaxID=2695856 RepID=A0A829YDA3_9GAMM|nr:hypothetical protein [Steroidobacter agaridevorans]GFE81235.1 hypothetical protein GCM10011487_32350 [Steroidobacter agaridevorans]GFE88881.1 hypothetical protein GCM10011488_38350 [Steroidobacter agaridevorans]